MVFFFLHSLIFEQFLWPSDITHQEPDAKITIYHCPKSLDFHTFGTDKHIFLFKPVHRQSQSLEVDFYFFVVVSYRGERQLSSKVINFEIVKYTQLHCECACEL